MSATASALAWTPDTSTAQWLREKHSDPECDVNEYQRTFQQALTECVQRQHATLDKQSHVPEIEFLQRMLLPRCSSDRTWTSLYWLVSLPPSHMYALWFDPSVIAQTPANVTFQYADNAKLRDHYWNIWLHALNVVLNDNCRPILQVFSDWSAWWNIHFPLPVLKGYLQMPEWRRACVHMSHTHKGPHAWGLPMMFLLVFVSFVTEDRSRPTDLPMEFVHSFCEACSNCGLQDEQDHQDEQDEQDDQIDHIRVWSADLKRYLGTAIWSAMSRCDTPAPWMTAICETWTPCRPTGAFCPVLSLVVRHAIVHLSRQERFAETTRWSLMDSIQWITQWFPPGHMLYGEHDILEVERAFPEYMLACLPSSLDPKNETLYRLCWSLSPVVFVYFMQTAPVPTILTHPIPILSALLSFPLASQTWILDRLGQNHRTLQNRVDDARGWWSNHVVTQTPKRRSLMEPALGFPPCLETLLIPWQSIHTLPRGWLTPGPDQVRDDRIDVLLLRVLSYDALYTHPVYQKWLFSLIFTYRHVRWDMPLVVYSLVEQGVWSPSQMREFVHLFERTFKHIAEPHATQPLLFLTPSLRDPSENEETHLATYRRTRWDQAVEWITRRSRRRSTHPSSWVWVSLKMHAFHVWYLVQYAQAHQYDYDHFLDDQLRYLHICKPQPRASLPSWTPDSLPSHRWRMWMRHAWLLPLSKPDKRSALRDCVHEQEILSTPWMWVLAHQCLTVDVRPNNQKKHCYIHLDTFLTCLQDWLRHPESSHRWSRRRRHCLRPPLAPNRISSSQQKYIFQFLNAPTPEWYAYTLQTTLCPPPETRGTRVTPAWFQSGADLLPWRDHFHDILHSYPFFTSVGDSPLEPSSGISPYLPWWLFACAADALTHDCIDRMWQSVSVAENVWATSPQELCLLYECLLHHRMIWVPPIPPRDPRVYEKVRFQLFMRLRHLLSRPSPPERDPVVLRTSTQFLYHCWKESRYFFDVTEWHSRPDDWRSLLRWSHELHSAVPVDQWTHFEDMAWLSRPSERRAIIDAWLQWPCVQAEWKRHWTTVMPRIDHERALPYINHRQEWPDVVMDLYEHWYGRSGLGLYVQLPTSWSWRTRRQEPNPEEEDQEDQEERERVRSDRMRQVEDIIRFYVSFVQTFVKNDWHIWHLRVPYRKRWLDITSVIISKRSFWIDLDPLDPCSSDEEDHRTVTPMEECFCLVDFLKDVRAAGDLWEENVLPLQWMLQFSFSPSSLLYQYSLFDQYAPEQTPLFWTWIEITQGRDVHGEWSFVGSARHGRLRQTLSSSTLEALVWSQSDKWTKERVWNTLWFMSVSSISSSTSARSVVDHLRWWVDGITWMWDVPQFATELATIRSHWTSLVFSRWDPSWNGDVHHTHNKKNVGYDTWKAFLQQLSELELLFAEGSEEREDMTQAERIKHVQRQKLHLLLRTMWNDGDLVDQAIRFEWWDLLAQCPPGSRWASLVERHVVLTGALTQEREPSPSPLSEEPFTEESLSGPVSHVNEEEQRQKEKQKEKQKQKQENECSFPKEVCCPICFHHLADRVLQCGHRICYVCFLELDGVAHTLPNRFASCLSSSNEPWEHVLRRLDHMNFLPALDCGCPICRTPVTRIQKWFL